MLPSVGFGLTCTRQGIFKLTSVCERDRALDLQSKSWKFEISLKITCVTVFRTYWREAVLGTTTHLPVGLILSCVVVDNCTRPSVPLGPHPGCHRFFLPNAHMHHQVSLVVMSHPPHAISHLNFHIKADSHLDPHLSLGRCQSRLNILKTSITPLDFMACRSVSLWVHS